MYDGPVSLGTGSVQGTILIYTGAIAFSITGLFLVSAACATLDSGVLPRWAGWLDHAAAVLCLVSVPAMFAGPVDATAFYNPRGWGSAIVTNFPPLIWFLVVGILLIRDSRMSEATAGLVPHRQAGDGVRPTSVASQ